MTMRKGWPRSLVLAGCVLAAVLTPGIGNAQYRGGTIKIGVLNDQSGLYADIAGTASVWMARKAVEDFGAAAKGMKVEIIGGDHQNKADLLGRARDQRAHARQEQGVPGGGPCDLRSHRQGVLAQHRALDIRHLGAGQ